MRNRTQGRRRSAGFTLIEVMVVIVILGILSAFAFPRFAGLEERARSAALDGISGSLRSGAALAHALWLAEGSSGTFVFMEGVQVDLVNGYPLNSEIIDTLQDISGFTQSAPGVFFPNGVSNPAQCQVQYIEPPLAGNAPQIVPTPDDGTRDCI